MMHVTWATRVRRLATVLGALTATLVLLATAPSAHAAAGGNGNGNGTGSGNGNGGGGTKVTICHRTASSSNPYVRISVDESGLNGHGDHEGDIIPAPANGCPTAEDGGSSGGSSGGTDAGTGTGTGGDSGSGSELPTGDGSGLDGVIGPCCTGPDAGDGPNDDTVPPTSTRRCTSTSPSTMYASGWYAVTIRSCRGSRVRIYGDPLVRTFLPGMFAPVTFGVGYGPHSSSLHGATVSWDTDATRRRVITHLTVQRGVQSVTMRPFAFQQAGDRRVVEVPLTDAQVKLLARDLWSCRGNPMLPISCRSHETRQPAHRSGRQ